MKILISATSDSIDAQFDPRFGRGAYFIFIDTETEAWTAEANAGTQASAGAGIHAAQQASNHEVDAIVSGHFGPKAFDALTAAGIEMYEANGGTVRDVLAKFKAGELPKGEKGESGHHH